MMKHKCKYCGVLIEKKYEEGCFKNPANKVKEPIIKEAPENINEVRLLLVLAIIVLAAVAAVITYVTNPNLYL